MSAAWDGRLRRVVVVMVVPIDDGPGTWKGAMTEWLW